MNLDPNNPADMQKLADLVAWNRYKLRPFRENRVQAIREYTGKWYSDDAAEARVPVNMIELMVTTFKHQMSARPPLASVHTPYNELKPTAKAFELVLNEHIKKMRLRDTMRKAITEALFGLTVAKVGLARGGKKVKLDGFLHDVGAPFVDIVTVDNFVYDTTANRWDQCAFMGDRYTIPYDQAIESKFYNHKGPDGEKAIDSVTPDPYASKNYNENGDLRASAVSMGINNYAGSVEGARTIELWDIWIPSQGVIVTLPAPTDTRGITGVPLRVVEWDGPEHGPYNLLSFLDVPGNLMPLPPVATAMDLHNLANVLFRKLARQAERQKTITAVSAGSGDGAKITAAADGQAIEVDNLKSAQQISFGGPAPENQAFELSLRDKFSYYQGNLDSIGGLGAQSKTARQDQMLEESSSKKIDDMQDQFSQFVTDVMRSVGYYIWTEPVSDYETVHKIQVAGLNLDIPIKLTPDERNEDYYRFAVDIVPHSMAPMTPQKRLNQLTQVLSQYVLPFQAPMAQQGVQINWEVLMKTVAEMSSLDELNGILTFRTPPMQDQVAPAGSVGQYQPQAKPAFQHKTVDRVTRSETTRTSRDAALGAALAGKPGTNNNQSMSKPIGNN